LAWTVDGSSSFLLDLHLRQWTGLDTTIGDRSGDRQRMTAWTQSRAAGASPFRTLLSMPIRSRGSAPCRRTILSDRLRYEPFPIAGTCSPGAACAPSRQSAGNRKPSLAAQGLALAQDYAGQFALSAIPRRALLPGSVSVACVTAWSAKSHLRRRRLDPQQPSITCSRDGTSHPTSAQTTSIARSTATKQASRRPSHQARLYRPLQSSQSCMMP